MKIPLFRTLPNYYNAAPPHIHTTLQGELSFEVWDKNSLDRKGNPLKGAEPRIKTPFQPQIVTDIGFETYLNGGSISREYLFQFMALGTGTAPASATDNSFAQIPGSGRFSIHSGGYLYTTSGNEITQTIEYRSAQGQVVGTATDCALFTGATGGAPMMRSLIKDANGIPTSLVLTSSDFIYIKWKVKSATNINDQTGTILLGEPGAEILYNWVMRPCQWNGFLTNGSSTNNMFVPVSANSAVNTGMGLNQCDAYNTQTLNTITGGPPGGIQSSGAFFSPNSYTANSKQRKMTYKWTITQGNFAGATPGIGAARFYNVNHPAGYQMSFAAASGGGRIPKDNTKEFVLDLMFTFGR